MSGLVTRMLWTSRLEAVLEAAGAGAEQMVITIGEQAAVIARQSVHRKTGETARSIRVVRPGETYSVMRRPRKSKDIYKMIERSKKVLTFKTKVHKQAKLVAEFPAAHLEYGTAHSRAYPFLRPALNQAVKHILKGQQSFNLFGSRS